MRTTRPLILTILFLAAGALAACGGSDSSSSGSSDAGGKTETVTLKVGAIPIANVASLMLGRQQGFFEEENLKVEPKFAQGGAAIIPAVMSGANDIGYGNITSIILARSKGLPITMIANSESSTDDPNHDSNAVVVKKSSPIKTAKDLNGKRISINTLQNINEMSVRAATDKLGGDSSTLKFVELPFPDMLPALDADRIDAAAIAEPFFSQAKASGKYRTIFYNLSQTKPNLLIDAYFVSDEYYAKNKDVVDRFRRAINKSNDYAQEHPDEVRKIITTYTKISAAEAKDIILPVWSGGKIDTESITLMQELMKRYGLFEGEPPSLNELIKGE